MSSPYPSAPKRLERSTTDKFLAGVCGGVARYLNMDPTLVRVLWVILTLVLGGAPLIVYLVMLFVVPEENSQPGYPPSVNGPQSQPGWAPYPQHDQPYPPAASPGPAPQPPQQSGTESQAVWGEGGAPWEQPGPPTFTGGGTGAPHPDSPAATGPDASSPEPSSAPGAAGSGVNDYDSVAGSATKGEHDDAAPSEPGEAPAEPDVHPDAQSDAHPDAHPDAHRSEENPADHNEQSSGQQPTS